MLLLLIFTFLYYFRGDSANAVPHDRYYAAEFPTFEEIAEVISPEVQWVSLALEKLPYSKLLFDQAYYFQLYFYLDLGQYLLRKFSH